MDRGSGLLEALRGIAQSLLGALRTRIELLGNELEEQGTRLARIAILLGLAGLCLALGVILGALLLVVLYWETNRVLVLAVLAGVFGAAGIAALVAARALANSRPRAFSATLAELAKDREALGAASEEKRA